MAIISRVYLKQTPDTVLANYLGDQAAVALIKALVDFDALQNKGANVHFKKLRVVYKDDFFSNRLTFTGCNPAGDHAYILAPVTRPDTDLVQQQDQAFTDKARDTHGDSGFQAMLLARQFKFQ
jgi:hypothetical protein